MKIGRKQKIEALNAVLVILIIWLIQFIVTDHILLFVTIPTSSMEPTIPAGTNAIALKKGVLFQTVKRGDIVIVLNEKDKYNTKRVVGLPGEILEIEDGKLYINGTYMDEPYVESMTGSFGPYTIPADSYFVMGDNRDESYDARYWENPYIEYDNIVGRIILLNEFPPVFIERSE